MQPSITRPEPILRQKKGKKMLQKSLTSDLWSIQFTPLTDWPVG